MMLRTSIQEVKDTPREWPGAPNGPMYFVSGSFLDGSEWDIGCKSTEKAAELIKALTALVGDTYEYEVEDKGKEYKGKKQYKLKNYPGKPERPFTAARAGGKEYVPRYRDTEQGAKEERDSISRSVALQQAVSFCVDKPDHGGEQVIRYADKFYQWLASTEGRPDFGPQKGPISANQVQAQSKSAENELKSKAQIASEEIGKCVMAQDLARLEAVTHRIGDRVISNDITLDEAEVLSKEINLARKSINSGKSYKEWWDAKVAEAQKAQGTVSPEMQELGDRF